MSIEYYEQKGFLMPDNRIVRTLINTKQSSLEYSGKPSINSMVDGQTAIERKPNGQLALYKKIW